MGARLLRFRFFFLFITWRRWSHSSSLSLSFLSSYILYSLSYPAAIKAQLGIFNSETRSAVQCSSTVECSAMMSLLNCYTNDNDDDDDDEDDDDG